MHTEAENELYDEIDAVQAISEKEDHKKKKRSNYLSSRASLVLNHLNGDPLPMSGENSWFVDVYPNDDNYYLDIMIHTVLKSKFKVEKWLEGCEHTEGPTYPLDDSYFPYPAVLQSTLPTLKKFDLVSALNQTQLERKHLISLNSEDSCIFDRVGMIGIMYEDGQLPIQDGKSCSDEVVQKVYVPALNPFERKFKTGKKFTYGKPWSASNSSRVYCVQVCNPYKC